MIWHVTCDHAAGSDHCEPPQSDTGKNGGIRSDAASVSCQSLRILGWILFTAGPEIIRKCYIRTYKNIVFESDSFPELYSAFNRYAVANFYSSFDKRMVAKIAVGTDN